VATIPTVNVCSGAKLDPANAASIACTLQ
jgi:hypothetical protein